MNVWYDDILLIKSFRTNIVFDNKIYLFVVLLNFLKIHVALCLRPSYFNQTFQAILQTE